MDLRERNISFFSRTLRRNLGYIKAFLYISICNYKLDLLFAFRNQFTSDLTLTRAVCLISAYALNAVSSKTRTKSSLTFVQDRCLFGSSRLASSTLLAVVG
jgi:hypothetical protein